MVIDSISNLKIIGENTHMKIFKKSKMVMIAGVFLASPVLTTPTVLAEVDVKKANQAAGYIGKLSKSAIAQGMLERLQSNVAYEDMERDTGHAYADLKTRIEFWHKVALDSVALDHTPLDSGGVPFEQGGPTRTSRALAMVQIAVFEAVNSIDREFESFTGRTGNGGNAASPDAASAQAAYDTLVSLYPLQEERLTAVLEADLAIIEGNEPTWRFQNGVRLGARASRKIMSDRRRDNSNDPEPNFGEGGRVADGSATFRGPDVNGGTANIGEWTSDPNTPDFSPDFNLALGAYWGGVRPFFLNSGDQFRAPEPPEIGTAAYAQAFAETAAIGGAPTNTQTVSTGTDDTRFVGNFWGYDGVPLVGVPPRVYNQIAAQIGGQEIQDPVEFARFLAMINTGMADVAIAAWDSKYFYNFWRPATGIRIDDGTDTTATDSTWAPVGISVVNTQAAVRPTPPFPSYPSGHATFGAMLFELMRDFFGDDTPFTFVSDEFNGQGVDPFFPNIPRPLVPVRYETLTQAQLENGRSRVFNGVHWDFDNLVGQQIGVNIAQFLLNDTQAFQPR